VNDSLLFFEKVLSIIKKRIEIARVGGSRRENLATNYFELTNLGNSAIRLISAGSFSKFEAATIKSAVGQLIEDIFVSESYENEIRETNDFFAKRVRELLEKVREKFGVNSSLMKDLRNESEKIETTSDSEGEKKTKLLAEFTGMLASILDKEIVHKFMKEFSTAKDYYSPSQNIVGSLSPAIKKIVDDKRKIKRALEEINFYYQNLKTKPGIILPASIKAIKEERLDDDLPEKVFAARDEIRRFYKKVKDAIGTTEYFRHKLKAYLAMPAEKHPLHSDIKKALRLDSISTDNFQKLVTKIEERLISELEKTFFHSFLETKVISEMLKLEKFFDHSYSATEIIMQLAEGKPVILETRHGDFRVFLKLTSNDSLEVTPKQNAHNKESTQNDKSKQSDYSAFPYAWKRYIKVLLENTSVDASIQVDDLIVAD